MAEVRLSAGIAHCRVAVEEEGRRLWVAFEADPRIPAVVTVLFTALRLAGVDHWQWAWVLFPLWGTVAAMGLCADVALVKAWRLNAAARKRRARLEDDNAR